MSFGKHLCAPPFRIAVEFIEEVLGRFPGVVVAGEVGLVAVDHRTLEALAAFAEHEERGAATFGFVRLCDFEELRDELLVEGKARDMAGGVNTEAVNTHFDELAVAVYDVFGYIVVLGVEIHAVACNLPPPAVGKVPVPACAVMVVIVVRLEFGVLEIFPALRILRFGILFEIVCAKPVGVGNHRCGYRCLVPDVLVAGEEGVEIGFSEVPGVL